MLLYSQPVDVQQNISSISSLIKSADEKYAAAQVLTELEQRNEEGLPLAEILEELDEYGNVICMPLLTVSGLLCHTALR